MCFLFEQKHTADNWDHLDIKPFLIREQIYETIWKWCAWEAQENINHPSVAIFLIRRPDNKHTMEIMFVGLATTRMKPCEQCSCLGWETQNHRLHLNIKLLSGQKQKSLVNILGMTFSSDQTTNWVHLKIKPFFQKHACAKPFGNDAFGFRSSTTQKPFEHWSETQKEIMWTCKIFGIQND